MAVKLKGVIATTNPSKGRHSVLFQTPGEDIGWSSYISDIYCTLKRKKSADSQAASISVWNTFLDCPNIVAALILSLYGPEIKSAAFKKIAALSYQGRFDHCSFRSEEHTSELQSRPHLVCRLLLEK